jgi:hypothetical protein
MVVRVLCLSVELEQWVGAVVVGAVAVGSAFGLGPPLESLPNTWLAIVLVWLAQEKWTLLR